MRPSASSHCCDRLPRCIGVGNFDLVKTAGQRLRKLIGKQRPRRAQNAAETAAANFARQRKAASVDSARKGDGDQGEPVEIRLQRRELLRVGDHHADAAIGARGEQGFEFGKGASTASPAASSALSMRKKASSFAPLASSNSIGDFLECGLERRETEAAIGFDKTLARLALREINRQHLVDRFRHDFRRQARPQKFAERVILAGVAADGDLVGFAPFSPAPKCRYCRYDDGRRR